MLNSFEIEKALIDHQSTLFKKNKRIKGYTTPSKEIVYIKTSNDPDKKPVHKKPLLINPSLRKFKSEIDNISGIEVDWAELRKNSNINRFHENGQALTSDRKSAYAVAVESESALKVLLTFINSKTL